MKRTGTFKTLLMGAAGVAAFSGVAHAAPGEFSLFLFDRTGSMSTVTNSATNTTRWTDAMDAAISLVTAKDTDRFVERAYSIWDFRLGAGTVGGPSNDTSQNNAKQVWPLVAADCTNLCGTGSNCATFLSAPTASGITNNFCVFPGDGGDAPYENLVKLLNSYKTDVNRTPDANFNGRTPMADALCRVLDQMRLATTNVTQVITLESDGLENQSGAGNCGNYSIASTAVPFSTDPAAVWQKSKSDWGMSADAGSGKPDAIDSTVFPGGGSWEARVVRRSLRLTNSNQVSATGTAIAANEPVTTNLNWRVHAHYTTFSSTTQTMALQTVSPTAAFGLAATSTKDTPSVQPQFSVSAFSAGLTASPTTTATAASTVTVSIPQAELTLFRQLGSPSFPSRSAATKSSFGAITLLPGQTFGTYHRLPGDVDDSGCTDRADYSIIMQKDVWRQRAVQPNQIAIRADLTKDGWVNEADRAVVIAKWGQGCINNPGPAPRP